MKQSDELIAAFDLRRYRFIHLIGGGGKTTIMLAMARALSERGKRVIATTSTRVRRSEGEALGKPLLVPDVGELAEKARAALARRNPIVLARMVEGEKLLGFPAEALEHLSAEGVADTLIVEADGAAGRPLKAHAPWEPVIASSADLVIIVLGAWCLGQPLDEKTVHRAERFAERVRCPLGTPLTAEHVVAILFHEDGYLRSVPSKADVMVGITSRADNDGGLARQVAAADVNRRLKRVVRWESVVDMRESCLARLVGHE
ncbi:MAG TPA: selenium cofactor biosynthesis protein YqeC [Thermoanaerobaculaceae bacterium]|nr:selenium cofactor biosynthesis protein YqeC [Thermoanaerobaculaceae bacterium]HPS77860.1 selenium cofactor biosynthesis protein YqeC [Thermoanaerobaculaceae bacterium]